MADTTFVNQTTVIDATWLNAMNDFFYTLFNGATTASAARTALGLGSISTQDAGNVALTGGTADSLVITGGNITGITDLAVADGGTGAGNATQARSNLSAQEDVITTRGDLVVGNSTPAASRLAVGTAGQVIESDGTDVTWATPDGWLYEDQVVAGNSTSIDFTNLDQSSYHLFVFRKIKPATDGADLRARTSDDAGGAPTFDSGASDFAFTGWLRSTGSASGTFATVEDPTADHMRVSAGSVGNTSALESGVTGQLLLVHPGDSGEYTTLHSSVFYGNSVGNLQHDDLTSWRNSAAVVQAIQFYYNTGNITSGTIDHYTRPVQ